MRSLDGSLLEEIRTHTQREDLVKTKGEDDHLQIKEKGFRMKSIFLFLF